MRGSSSGADAAPRGFSLIEVIVALLILNVGFLGVLGLVRLSAHTFSRARLLQHQVLTLSALGDSLALEDPRSSAEWRFPWGIVRLEGGDRFRVESPHGSWTVPAP
jgi:prepilin-type N-terminal cleavage/methylation domain-containing protein